MKKLIYTLVMSAAVMSGAVSAAYVVKRSDDGNFAFSISGININEGSTLKRETILLNNSASTVEITSGNLSFDYKDRGFVFTGKTGVKFTKPVKAIEVRHAVYDVFGKHVTNLSNTNAKDYGVSDVTLDGEWRASDNYVSEVLTNVVYVARVRFNDGTQWVADWSDVSLEMAKLKLEKLADPKELDK